MNRLKLQESIPEQEETVLADPAPTPNILALLPALPLAEDLDAELLLEAIDAETQRKIKQKAKLREGERQYRLGCLLLEQGLLRETSQVAASRLFEGAQHHFDEGLEIEDTPAYTFFRIGYTSASMPFFRDRKTSAGVSTEEAEQAWYDIGALAGNAAHYTPLPSRQLDILSATGIPLFLMRQKVRVYTTTFREGYQVTNNLPGKKPNFRHTSYTIPDGSKLAIRASHLVKCTRPEAKSDSMAPIALGKLIRSQVNQLLPNKFPHDTPAPLITMTVMNMIIRESRDERVDPQELALLNSISKAIQERLFLYSNRRAMG